MADLARQAAVRLAYEYEVFVEVVIPTQLAPFEIEPIIQSSETTGSILVIEEGNKALGWGAEIISGVAEKQISSRTKFQRLAAKDMPVPSSCSLEALILPGIDQIIQAAIQANKSE
jgi:pyruvate dehydrogenase E1 component beta subunit